MSDQLIPPPDVAPRMPPDATPSDCLAAWVDVMDACEMFLLAGLRNEIGPEGDLRSAHRQWYVTAMREHDQTVHRMATELHRRSQAHDG